MMMKGLIEELATCCQVFEGRRIKQRIRDLFIYTCSTAAKLHNELNHVRQIIGITAADSGIDRNYIDGNYRNIDRDLRAYAGTPASLELPPPLRLSSRDFAAGRQVNRRRVIKTIFQSARGRVGSIPHPPPPPVRESPL